MANRSSRDDYRTIARSISTTRGPVSGDRGHVRRWDAGTYQTEQASDREHVVRVYGNQLTGLLRFEKSDSADDWTLAFDSRTE